MSHHGSGCAAACLSADPCSRCEVLLGLDGGQVEHVERRDRVMVVTVSTPQQLTGCSGCGVIAVGRGRRRIQIAALDPFTGYKTAIDNQLEDAVAVLDAFHVVKLGTAAVAEVRRGSNRTPSGTEAGRAPPHDPHRMPEEPFMRDTERFIRLPDDPESVAKTWQWVRDGEHGLLVGLVAVDDENRPVALASLRWFARPATATAGLYLDDLFTSSEARGTGAASALLKEAAVRAREGEASVVRWITAADNATARSVYDSHAVATPWVI